MTHRFPAAGRLLGQLRVKPVEVLTLAGMDAVAAVACLMLFAHPISVRSPRMLDGACAALAIIFVGLLLTLQRVPRVLLHVAVILWLLALTAGVALASTPQGATGTAVPYTWLLIYTAYFLTPTAARCYAGLTSVALAAALLLNSYQGAFAIWAEITFTAVAGAELLIWLLGRLRKAALIDPLTGLYNRAGLVLFADQQIALARRRDLPLALATIDLDGFKDVNDQLGHAAGDQLLAITAQAWSGQLRSADLLFRSGGDEFVILLPGTTREQADASLARLRHDADTPWSYGVAALTDGDNLDACLMRADRALYQDKARRQDAPQSSAPAREGRLHWTAPVTGST